MPKLSQASHVMPTWACAKAGIYGRWYKKMKTNTMASTGIDPMPLPTNRRRDDIPVEACTTIKDGFSSYRSHAFAHEPTQG